MNVGLIGCGRVAHIHMGVYKAMSNVNVVAVSDVDINRANDFAEPYRIDETFSDYKDLFEVKDLDLIDVCTPTSTHEFIVSDAARSGLNVLMEKPMGRNSEECEKMIEESRKHGTQLCVCHNQLFFPHVQRLKSIAGSEDFNLTSFRTSHRENFEWLRDHGLAQPWNVSPEHGGILWEVGCHLAYIQLSFLKDIEEVYALGVKAKHPVWDDFVVLLRTSSQRWGIMEISWVAQESEIVYEVIDSDGRRIQTYCKFAVNQVTKPQLGHFGLINSYVESLENSSPSPVTGEDGRNAIKLLECIEESLEERRPVTYSSW